MPLRGILPFLAVIHLPGAAPFTAALAVLPATGSRHALKGTTPGTCAVFAGRSASRAVPRVLSSAATEIDIPSGYYLLTDGLVADFICGLPKVAQRIGTTSPDQVQHSEIGYDGGGRMNLVFRCTGPTGTVVVKQALPYLRCAEDWPLTLERGRFEYMGLVEMAEHCHGLVPEPYHFDEVLGALVMEYIPPTHTVLRYSLIEGRCYSTFARHLGTFLARSLFFTSGIHLTGPQLRAKVAFWSTNAEMNDVLLQCIFVEPWVETPTNRWTSPQLDDVAASIRGDVPLRIAIAELREKFMCNTQALIHSDFHTGAAMVCEGSTFVIDPEFAVYGPMGFEVGAILAGLIISYCSQRGHRADAAELDAYGDWLLAQVVTLHETFERAFLALWSDPALAAGCTWPQRQFAGGGELRAAQAHFMRRLWRDTVGFAGVKVMRRIIGRIHFDDFETIVDPDVRAACERRALTIGRTLVKEPDSVASVHAFVDFMRNTR